MNSFTALIFDQRLFIADSEQSVQRFINRMEYEIDESDDIDTVPQKRSQPDESRGRVFQGVHEFDSIVECFDFLHDKYATVSTVYRLDKSEQLFAFPMVKRFYHCAPNVTASDSYIQKIVNLYPHLEEIDFSRACLSNEAIQIIGTLKHLSTFIAYETNVDFSPLQSLTHLHSLNVTFYPESMPFTAQMNSLQNLTLDSDTAFPCNQQLIEICKFCPNLIELSFDGCQCDSRIFKYLRDTLKNLKRLYITNIGFDCSVAIATKNNQFASQYQVNDTQCPFINGSSEQELIQYLEFRYIGEPIKVFFEEKKMDYGNENAVEYDARNYETQRIRRLTNAEYIYSMVRNVFYNSIPLHVDHYY
jgi:hypothetical protein